MSKKSQKTAKLTIKEFQTWLEGIMEFQKPDWSPNNEQWSAIYDKIMNLKQEASTSTISAPSMNRIEEIVSESKEDIINELARLSNGQNFSQRAAASRYTQDDAAPEPRGALYDEPPQSQPDMQPIEIISQEEFPQLTPEQIQERIAKAKAGMTSSVPSTTSKISTPHLDTSDGNYKPGFL